MEILRPFILTSWHGHRDDADLPRQVEELWRSKFAGPLVLGPGEQSNVDLAILDPDGALLHSFDAFRFRREQWPVLPREPLPLVRYTLAEVERGIERLGEAPPELPPHPLDLPELSEGLGVRVFTRLLDGAMPAYAAPLVDAVPLGAADWRHLAYPAEERVLEAGALFPWLSKLLPPGIMERTDTRTKLAFLVAKVEGSLTLRPAGAEEDERYALLQGVVRLTDEGPGEFSWGGELRVVLSYGVLSPSPAGLRGTFEGSYLRRDLRRRTRRELPLQGVFELCP